MASKLSEANKKVLQLWGVGSGTLKKLDQSVQPVKTDQAPPIIFF